MNCWFPFLHLGQESRQRRCFCVNTLSKSCPSPPLPNPGSNLPNAASNSQSIERIPALAASLFNKLCCAIKPNQWNSTTMITNLFLKSYNQSSIWRTKGEKKMPQHDMIAGFQCIPGEDSVQFLSDVAKILSKNCFWQKPREGEKLHNDVQRILHHQHELGFKNAQKCKLDAHLTSRRQNSQHSRTNC